MLHYKIPYFFRVFKLLLALLPSVLSPFLFLLHSSQQKVRKLMFCGRQVKKWQITEILAARPSLLNATKSLFQVQKRWHGFLKQVELWELTWHLEKCCLLRKSDCSSCRLNPNAEVNCRVSPANCTAFRLKQGSIYSKNSSSLYWTQSSGYFKNVGCQKIKSRSQRLLRYCGEPTLGDKEESKDEQTQITSKVSLTCNLQLPSWRKVLQ